MKKCDKHHGDITYDEVIYLECPLCKMNDYDEVMEDNVDLNNFNDDLKLITDRVWTEISELIDEIGFDDAKKPLKN